MKNAATLEFNQAVCSARSNFLAWLVTLTTALFFFYQFIQLNAFNSLNTFVMNTFHLSSTQVGTLSSYFFYTNILFLFPAGMMLDRMSARKLVAVGLFICATSVLLFAIAESYWLAAVSRLLTGIGSAFCFLSCVRIATRWFPPQKMAFVMGIVVTMAMLGGMVAQTPFSLLIEATSWRHALLMDAVLGYVFMILAWFVIRDYPPNHQSENQHEHAQVHKMGILQSFKFVLTNCQNWFGGLYTALLNLPIFILGAIWGILYLSQAQGVSTTQASYATSMLFVGTIFGAPAFGWLSDKMERRKLPMLVGGLLSLATVAYLMYVPGLSVLTVIVLFFLLGFFTSAQIISYPLIAELNPLAVTSTATSIISFCIMLSGAIAQPFFGWLIGLHWTHQQLSDGTPLYLISDYRNAMLVLPISFIIGIVISLFVKETYCKSRASALPE